MSKQRDPKNLVVGLDIGTSKIVCIVAEINDEGVLDIIGMGTSPSRGLRRGVVVNIEATVNAIQRALEEAELMADCKIREVLHRHCGQPHQELQLARHVRHQGQGNQPDGVSTGWWKLPAQSTSRPTTNPAHHPAGIHRRWPGRRARSARHERSAT